MVKNPCHVNQVYVALNETARIITEFLKSTKVRKFHPLTRIAPPRIRRGVRASPERKWNRLFFGHIVPTCRLKPRNSFLQSTLILVNYLIKLELTRMWNDADTTDDDDGHKEVLPCDHNLPWKVWHSFNRLRTRVTRCNADIKKKWSIEKDAIARRNLDHRSPTAVSANRPAIPRFNWI